MKNNNFIIKTSVRDVSFDGDTVFVIAEIGKNFIQSEDDRPVEEYLKNAKALVDAAGDAGADAVKFQTHEIEDEVLNIEFTSPHFKTKGSDRYGWVKRNTKATPLEGFWKPLKKYCDEKEIIFFSTPMSRQAAEKLETLNVPLWKVGSGDVGDYVMLDYLTGTGKPIIISSGMVSLRELDGIINYFQDKNTPLIVLYCVSQYPCPLEHFNLGTIEYLKEKYPNLLIGFSDHSVGSHEVALSAIALGARVIEKHFSFSRMLWGSDHKASLTPKEFKVMVNDIRSKKWRNIDSHQYYGDKERELEGAHNEFRPYFNKALISGCDIKRGTKLTKEMLYAMRPVKYSKGLKADVFYDVLGKRVKKDIKKYEPITWEILE